MNSISTSIVPIKTRTDLSPQDILKIDFSKIDNCLEHALLPFNDAFILSKITEKLKHKEHAQIQGTFANLPIKLVIKGINTSTLQIQGKIGNNEINSSIIFMQSENMPFHKKRSHVKNIDQNLMLNSSYIEDYQGNGSQNISSVLLADYSQNIPYSQFTLTYDPQSEKSFYKVKNQQNQHLVEATYSSLVTSHPTKTVQTHLLMQVDSKKQNKLHVKGKIIQENQEWIINYKIE
ncbi:MAG: hypothetical protein ABDH21_06645 [bacterium]